jgi:VNT family MFS transporter (synaptic vesicle glycoprotein 2)
MPSPPPPRRYGSTDNAPELLAAAAGAGDAPPAVRAPGGGGDGESPATSAGSPRRVSPQSELDFIGFGRFQVRMLAVLGLANASDAVELLALSFILPVLEESGGELAKTSATGKAALSAAIFGGMLLGGLFFGVAADSLGRRTTLAVSLAINAAFGLASAAAPTFGALVTARVLGGFGVGGSIPGVFTLAAELLPGASRAFWLSTVAWWWMVGAVYAAGMAWLLIGTLGLPWQLFAVVATVPAGAASALVFFLLPESPRFLHGAGRGEDAKAALLAIARANRVESRLVRGWDLAPPPTRAGSSGAEAAPSAGADAEREAAGLLASGDGGGGGGGGGGGNRARSILKAAARLVPTRAALRASLIPLRALFVGAQQRTTALLCVVWFSLSFGWYGLLLWVPTLFKESNVELDVYQDAFLVSAANLPGNVVSALLMDRVGVKAVLFYSMLAACAFAASFPYARTEAAVLLVTCSLNAVSTCSWNSLDCLSVRRARARTHVRSRARTVRASTSPPVHPVPSRAPQTEAFPTRHRTTALGVLSATGRLGSIMGQFVFGLLINYSLTALLASAASVLLVGALASLALGQDARGGTVFGARTKLGDDDDAEHEDAEDDSGALGAAAASSSSASEFRGSEGHK